jgi:hypothetical protein
MITLGVVIPDGIPVNGTTITTEKAKGENSILGYVHIFLFLQLVEMCLEGF